MTDNLLIALLIGSILIFVIALCIVVPFLFNRKDKHLYEDDILEDFDSKD